MRSMRKMWKRNVYTSSWICFFIWSLLFKHFHSFFQWFCFVFTYSLFVPSFLSAPNPQIQRTNRTMIYDDKVIIDVRQTYFTSQTKNWIVKLESRMCVLGACIFSFYFLFIVMHNIVLKFYIREWIFICPMIPLSNCLLQRSGLNEKETKSYRPSSFICSTELFRYVSTTVGCLSRWPLIFSFSKYFSIYSWFSFTSDCVVLSLLTCLCFGFQSLHITTAQLISYLVSFLFHSEFWIR